MKLTLKEAADFVGGVVYGNPNLEITGIAKIEEAKNDELTFLYLPGYEHFLASTKASAVLIAPKFSRTRKDISYIEVKDPNIALNRIIKKHFKQSVNIEGHDKSAWMHYATKIALSASIGKNVIVSEGCEIGDNSIVLHNTVLMDNVKIGKNCLIYPNVTIRENCILGDNVIIHSNTCVGSDGFGYIPNDAGEYEKVPQIGNVVLEDDVELGSNVSIDRAALGSTLIKKGTKIDNLVQIAHNVVVGENSIIISQSGIAGSAKIGKNCIIAGQAGVVGHIELADGVTITAQSGVSKSIDKAGKYRGTPAAPLGETLRIESHIRNLPSYAEKIKKLEEKIAFLEAKISEKK
ncbi:MAG: UDP-3-O-(3-hydroxymyristoyl) glucosamine N-acyltransferase [Ignavibacteria bacterium]|nr:MAG: UDP-3-O-(3-hydroxymyristoyl) glucosamine N-acyltransferase [Ignavibacteria bacterium]KAF0160433.1 MAG: UDP-3-O-(3-hydroxymyristoyl) glucosamine N-acyltransferase [Ignavibacteria bacterium]